MFSRSRGFCGDGGSRRILAIRGENIASLNKFNIDFTTPPLLDAGLYAITGPTGSGKSTLLDAMCLALFVRAPRLDGVSATSGELDSALGVLKFNAPTNLVRRGCSTCFAEVDFLGLDGFRYRARWGYRAPKRKGASPQAEYSLVHLDNQQVLVQGAKVNEYLSEVEKRLGWSYEQFTRAVLLAQGRFAEFLKAPDDVRADLLEKLTGTAIYSQISARIFQRAKDESLALAHLKNQAQGQEPLSVDQRRDLEQQCQQLRTEISTLSQTESQWRDFLQGAQAVSTAQKTLCQLETQKQECVEKGQQANQEHVRCQEWLQKVQQEWDLLEPVIQKAQSLDQQIEHQQRSVQQAQQVWQTLQNKCHQLQQDLARNHSELQLTQAQIETAKEWLEAHPQAVDKAQRWDWIQHILQDYSQKHTLICKLEKELETLKQAQDQAAHEAQRQEQEALAQLETCQHLAPDILEQKVQECRQQRTQFESALRYESLRRELESEHQLTQDLQHRHTQELQHQIATEAREFATRQALELAQLTQSQSVEALRAHLQDHSPCPVCGTLEHPYAHGSSAFIQLCESQKKQWDAARSDLQKANQLLSTTAALLQQHQQRLQALQPQWESLTPPEAPLAQSLQAAPTNEWLPWSSAKLAEKDQELTLLENQLAASHRAQKARMAADAARSRHENQSAAWESAHQHHLETRQQIEQLEQQLAPFFAHGWSTELHTNPTPFIQRESQQVQQVKGYQQTHEQATLRLATLHTQAQSLATQHHEREQESKQASDQLIQHQQTLQILHQQRLQLLEGQPWEPLQQQAKLQRQQAQERWQQAEQTLRIHRDLYKEIEGALKNQQQAWQNALDQLALSPVRSSPLVATLPEPEQVPAVAKHLNTLHAQLETQRTHFAQLQAQITADDSKHTQFNTLQQQMADQRHITERWNQLKDLIGSQDGKAFRKIAQQFTLEQLLDYANTQLAGITTRYQLEILPGTMNFCVVDAESYGEKRPVHTLSGGESFMVSLALALGLAQMAAGQLTVESLFIDEGFGTLDSDTLRSVMDALSGLQAQGRKVGLITHVEEMKHQIPVRIEVTRQGQGGSTVQVVG